MTLAQIAERITRDSEGKIHIDGNKEIAFVYYRTGYQFEQYSSEACWEARTVMECSKAIKCPSIDVHLTTFKKF